MKVKIIVAIAISVLTIISFLLMGKEDIENNIIEDIGTVKYIPIEGGFYGIISDSGERYLPLNLPDEFKKDNIKVKFKAIVKKKVITFQMWGKPVEILEINKIKND